MANKQPVEKRTHKLVKGFASYMVDALQDEERNISKRTLQTYKSDFKSAILTEVTDSGARMIDLPAQVLAGSRSEILDRYVNDKFRFGSRKLSSANSYLKVLRWAMLGAGFKYEELGRLNELMAETRPPKKKPTPDPVEDFVESLKLPE